MSLSNPAPDPSVEALFFGRPADVLGPRLTVDVPPEGLTLGALRRRLAETARTPEVLLDRTVRGAIDGMTAAEANWVLPGQEVAFFSAVSGG